MFNVYNLKFYLFKLYILFIEEFTGVMRGKQRTNQFILLTITLYSGELKRYAKTNKPKGAL